MFIQLGSASRRILATALISTGIASWSGCSGGGATGVGGNPGSGGSGLGGGGLGGSGAGGSGTGGSGLGGKNNNGGNGGHAQGGKPGPSSGGAGGSASGSGGAMTACAPLPVAGRVVDVADAAALVAAVRAATAGTTLLLADGTYAVGGQILQLKVDNLTLRSKSGQREAVIVDGQWNATSGEIVSVTGNHVTVADLTIARAYTHAIHVQSTDTADVVGTTIFNVHVVDALEQAIKINFSAARTHFTDDGVVACSHLELTGTGRPQVRNNCYTGGIDAHGARGWHIHDNLIAGFYCAQGLSEHGVHFWTGSRDTVVERNRIFNSARGIGFGLGETTASSTDEWRTYADEPCHAARPVGHYGGIIRNNFIFANDAALFASASGFDSGAAFEQACGTTVVHNTIFGTTAPVSSAIEWRFANSDVTVTNNLANAAFKNRGAGAQGTVAGNLATATAASFAAAASGDLHLVAPATGLRGGVAVAAGLCDEDIDGDARPSRDVGADQLP